jgi:hypothetical protein
LRFGEILKAFEGTDGADLIPDCVVILEQEDGNRRSGS